MRCGLVDLLLQLHRLCLQAVHGAGSVPAKAFLAGDVLAHLGLARHHALDGIAYPCFLAVELVAPDGKTLIFRGARDLCFPQLGQRGGPFGAGGGAGGRSLGAFRCARARRTKGIVAFGKRGFRIRPSGKQKLGLGLADAVRDRPVPRCLAGLLAQRIALLDKAGDDVVQPFQIGLGGAEPQFRLMAAGMQAPNIRGFLEKGAPVDRAGADDGTNPSLRDDAGRPRAGGRISKQKLYVLGAGGTGIHIVVASLAAFDLAGDLDLVLAVEFAWRGAVAVVQMKGDLGKVAGRTLVGAREDHVVHLGAAHLAGVAFAHHPAQTFDDIRLATAVRADNPGQAGIDLDLRAFGKGLETRHLEAAENHGLLSAPLRRKGFGRNETAIHHAP